MKKGRFLKMLIEFYEALLGTAPKNPDTYTDYVASKIAKRKDLTDDEQLELKNAEIVDAYNDIEAVEARGWTTFLKDEAGWYVFNYWVRGYLKSAFQSMQETGDFKKIKGFKTRVDRFVHVHPRKIHFITDLTELPMLERPLRIMTPHGPRVCLVRSDYLPEGTRMEFFVELLHNNEISMEMVEQAFSWGRYEGMGQWRSGGYGAFNVIEMEWQDPDPEE